MYQGFKRQIVTDNRTNAIEMIESTTSQGFKTRKIKDDNKKDKVAESNEEEEISVARLDQKKGIKQENDQNETKQHINKGYDTRRTRQV